MGDLPPIRGPGFVTSFEGVCNRFKSVCNSCQRGLFRLVFGVYIYGFSSDHRADTEPVVGEVLCDDVPLPLRLSVISSITAHISTHRLFHIRASQQGVRLSVSGAGGGLDPQCTTLRAACASSALSGVTCRHTFASMHPQALQDTPVAISPCASLQRPNPRG